MVWVWVLLIMWVGVVELGGVVWFCGVVLGLDGFLFCCLGWVLFL